MEADERRRRTLLWLISNIRVYLTGFLISRNLPESSRKTQKSGRIEHAMRAFSMSVFTMVARYANETLP
jgi:hypothetical protein